MSYVSIVPTGHDIAVSRPCASAGDHLTAFLFGAQGHGDSGIEGRASVADVFALENLRVSFDRGEKILWWSMKPQGRPSFTAGLLADMNSVADSLETAFTTHSKNDEPNIAHLVLSSQMPGIFNLGGDLRLFLELIERRDCAALTCYAHRCAEGQHRIVSNFGLPISTIALVQGDALGGGFEAALANDIIIAERSAKFGLPEVLFNLFPGMGAYSLLARRVGAVQAERMILSGRIYSADELHEMGIVDHVADDGDGTAAVYDFVAGCAKNGLARQAVLRTRRIVNPVTRDELLRVADVWVETALMLTARDLRRMRHLAQAQDRRCAAPRDR